MKKVILSVIVLLSFTTLFAQPKQENIRIFWPPEYKWKIIGNFEDSVNRFLQLIPGDDSVQRWSIVGHMSMIKNNFKAANIDKVIEVYSNSSLEESPLARITIIEKDSASKNFWAIFKVETPSFPNDPLPESQLWYVIQGDVTLYTNFVAIRKETLSEEFVSKWTTVFKSSKLEYK